MLATTNKIVPTRMCNRALVRTKRDRLDRPVSKVFLGMRRSCGKKQTIIFTKLFLRANPNYWLLILSLKGLKDGSELEVTLFYDGFNEEYKPAVAELINEFLESIEMYTEIIETSF